MSTKAANAKNLSQSDGQSDTGANIMIIENPNIPNAPNASFKEEMAHCILE